VVDAVDDGEVGAVGRGRDDHPLGPRRQMRCRLVARREDAGALQRDIDAAIPVRQAGGVLDRRHPDLAAVDHDEVAVDLDVRGEAAVDAVEAQQMRIGLDRAEIVDLHDLDVLAARFHDGAQDVAPDAAEPVDGDANRHD